MMQFSFVLGPRDGRQATDAELSKHVFPLSDQPIWPYVYRGSSLSSMKVNPCVVLYHFRPKLLGLVVQRRETCKSTILLAQLTPIDDKGVMCADVSVERGTSNECRSDAPGAIDQVERFRDMEPGGGENSEEVRRGLSLRRILMGWIWMAQTLSTTGLRHRDTSRRQFFRTGNGSSVLFSSSGIDMSLRVERVMTVLSTCVSTASAVSWNTTTAMLKAMLEVEAEP
ncbi:hypothetical protein F5Y18DRAFT_203679 [Xylariaceae sp. FL1019]|nr:hypothetical protein F5Y18DRAFT_203679 [Xylariaceae sp. FL1019]